MSIELNQLRIFKNYQCPDLWFNCYEVQPAVKRGRSKPQCRWFQRVANVSNYCWSAKDLVLIRSNHLNHVTAFWAMVPQLGGFHAVHLVQGLGLEKSTEVIPVREAVTGFSMLLYFICLLILGLYHLHVIIVTSLWTSVSGEGNASLQLLKNL